MTPSQLAELIEKAKEAKPVYAQGASDPVLFKEDPDRRRKWPKVTLEFGATILDCPDYPVYFCGIENIKSLHDWLGLQIAAYEAKLTEERK